MTVDFYCVVFFSAFQFYCLYWLQLLLVFWLCAASVACVVLAVCYTKGVIVELFMVVRNRHDEKVVCVLG